MVVKLGGRCSEGGEESEYSFRLGDPPRPVPAQQDVPNAGERSSCPLDLDGDEARGGGLSSYYPEADGTENDL